MLTREDLIIQSVEDMIRDHLFTDIGLPPTEVVLKDAFDYQMFMGQEFDQNYVAMGFNFDDGGHRGEMGSDLIVKKHNIEVWVFATNPQIGQNIASQVQHCYEIANWRVPLKNFEEDGDPVIDYLLVDDGPGPKAARQPHPNPEPWQENAWLITAKVTDEYYASAWS